MHPALARSLVALSYPLRLVAHLTTPVAPSRRAHVEFVHTGDGEPVSGAARRS